MIKLILQYIITSLTSLNHLQFSGEVNIDQIKSPSVTYLSSFASSQTVWRYRMVYTLYLSHKMHKYLPLARLIWPKFAKMESVRYINLLTYCIIKNCLLMSIMFSDYSSYTLQDMPCAKSSIVAKFWYSMSRQSSIKGSYITSFFIIDKFKLKLLRRN